MPDQILDAINGVDAKIALQIAARSLVLLKPAWPMTTAPVRMPHWSIVV